jgi:putative transposase
MLHIILPSVISALNTREAPAAENLALRHQLIVLQRNAKKPRLLRFDRILWVFLSKVWAGWRGSLIIVRPETVIRWHREGFRLYWKWQCRPRRPGRPQVDGAADHRGFPLGHGAEVLAAG